MQWNYEGPFLEQFPQRYRGVVTNAYCNAFREGARTVEGMSAWVERHAHKVLLDDDTGFTKSDADRRFTMLRLIEAIPTEEAMQFADFIRRRESVPYSERVKVRDAYHAAVGAEFAKQRMQAEPPTEKQLKYLKALGCKETPKSKLEASELINRYKNGDAQESRTEANSRAAGY